MRKLVFVLMALFVVFTLLRVYADIGKSAKASSPTYLKSVTP